MLKKPRKTFTVKPDDGAPRKVINLDDEDPLAVNHEIGTLVIIILKAKNLNDNHFRKQDVYAQVTLNGVKKKTQVDIRAGQHPLWDMEVRYPIMKSAKAKHRKLEVACYSEEPRPLPDQLLGRAVVDLSDTLKSGEFDDWVNLDVDGVQRGEIYLEMTFYSNAPVPAKNKEPTGSFNNKFLADVLASDSLQRRPSKLPPADRLSRPRQASGSGPSNPGPYQQVDYYPPAQHPQPYPYGDTPSSLKPSYPSFSSSPHGRSRSDTFTPSPQEMSSRPRQASGSGPSNSGPYQHVDYSPPAQQLQPYPYGDTPSTLKPAYPHGRSDTFPPSPQEMNSSPPPLPSLLRPGGGRTPPSSSPIPIPQQLTPIYGHQRPASSPSPQPYFNPQVANSPPAPNNPYFAGSANSSPGSSQIAYVSPQPPVHNLSPTWRHDSYNSQVVDSGIHGAGGFAFRPPVPETRTPTLYPPPPQQVGYGIGRPTHVRENSDPALIARYSSPLPLPPGANPRVAQPAPPVIREAPPMFESLAPTNYNVPPIPPPKATTPSPDGSRVEALKRAEAEAKRRHEQELRDLEIAMKLDRELNMT